MTTILHLVWHDVRALRLPLIAWLALLLAQAAVMAVGPGLVDPEGPARIPVLLAGLLAGARLAFTILLSVLLVQGDSPVGTTAFWLTRPIQPAAMAASKALSAALFLVVPPAVVGWVLFTALELPQADVLDGIANLAVEQVMLVSLAALGAAVTATIPQFAVVAVAGMLLIGSITSEARPFVDRLPLIHLPGAARPLTVWTAVTLLGTVAVLAYQYSRRRVLRASVGVFVVLMAGALAALTARSSLGIPAAKPILAEILNPGAISVVTESDALRAEWGTTFDRGRKPMRQRYVAANLRTSGAPPAIVLQPWSIRSTWSPRGAESIQWQRLVGASYRVSVRSEADGDGQPLRSIGQALGDVEMLRPVRHESTAYRMTLLSVSETEWARLAALQGPLDATLTLRAWRYRVADAAPLAAGHSVSARQGRLTVRAARPTREGVHVDVERVFLQRLAFTSEDSFGSGGIGSGERLLIRNKSRRQAVLLSAETGEQFSYSLIGGSSDRQLATGVRRLMFVVSVADAERIRIDDDWLSGAELVVMRPEDLGAFTKPLRVEWLSLGEGR